MANPVIVGVHGLANKPDENTLQQWWRMSIEEGLRKNENNADAAFDFEIVYWADILYKNPLHQDHDYHFDQLYNEEPYEEAFKDTIKRKKDRIWDDLAAAALDLSGETLDTLKARFGVNALADAFLGKLLKDLNLYYENDEIRAALRARLTDKLLAHQGRNIMLVGHSMGSIIAYDVLTLVGQSDPGFEVEQFVTIGSPLGLPHVKGKIIDEFVHRGQVADRVRTPTVVRKGWTNFADRKDPVALDVYLADDYKPNKHGTACKDDLVHNDYRIIKRGEKEPDRNPHKSYGYLRTPEFSELVQGFI